MKITPITILLSLGALFFLYLTIKSALRNKIGVRTACLWLVMWLSVAFFSIFPSMLDGLMSAAGMMQRVFFILIVAVIALLAMVFHLMSKLDQLKHDLARTIQEVSLLSYKIEQAERFQPTKTE